MKPALLIGLTATFLLTGCGGSHARKPTTLAARLRADNEFNGSPKYWKVSCARPTCTVEWNDRVWGDRSDWLGVFAEAVTIDADFPSIRHLTIKVNDPGHRRAAIFACAFRYRKPNWVGSAPFHPCVERVRTLGERLGVSAERVRQIEERALAKLRHAA